MVILASNSSRFVRAGTWKCGYSSFLLFVYFKIEKIFKYSLIILLQNYTQKKERKRKFKIMNIDELFEKTSY